MLSFEAVVLVILGVVAGAELVNVFMLGNVCGLGESRACSRCEERTQARSCSEQHATAEGRGPFATAAGW